MKQRRHYRPAVLRGDGNRHQDENADKRKMHHGGRRRHG